MPATTLPAYLVHEGDCVVVPGTDTVKKVYAVRDAGVRFETNDYGQVEHIIRLEFHYNAPPRSGLSGVFTVDGEAEVVVR